MKRILAIISIFWSVWAYCLNTPPLWYNEDWRMANYPRDLYIQGFVVGEVQVGESIEQTHQRVKEKAQAEAVQNIVTTIEYNANSVTHSSQTIGTSGFQETTQELFVTSTSIHSAIKDIPNLSIESWHHPASNQVFAFAWVKKSELSLKLTKQIINKITRAEIALEEAEELLKDGEKIAARNKILQSVSYLQQIEEYQTVIQSVDVSTTIEDLSLAESTTLKQRTTALYQQVKNGVFVYIGGEVSIFGETYPAFVQQIKQEISPIGCTFTTNEDNADWVVRLRGTTREYNTLQGANFNAFFVLSEINLQIIKGKELSIIFEGIFSEKGAHTLSTKEAAYSAYKNTLNPIAIKIMEIINQ